MSRRSTRIQAQKHTTPSQMQTSLDMELVSSESGKDEAPSTTSRGSQRKKQKTGKEKISSAAAVKRRRGIRGILSRLTEMSLDVLYEIFGHLEPADLLHLARTTKSLRRVILNRSAIGVWKQTLGNIPGLPACPKDISEPSYASLLFEHYCHVITCGTVTRGNNIQWGFRKRFCNKCVTNEFDTAAHDIAKGIVSLCGLDPVTASAEDMDNLDPVFACERCNKGGLRCCMRWKEAITHTLYGASSACTTCLKHVVHPQNTFTLITDEAVQVKIKLLLEAKKLARYNLPPYRFEYRDEQFCLFDCTHYRERGAYQGVKDHMTTHGVTNISTPDDSVVSADIIIDADPHITCVYRFDEYA